jgi:hypothetical protein
VNHVYNWKLFDGAELQRQIDAVVAVAEAFEAVAEDR